MESEKNCTTIAMVPCPGLTHLLPHIEFAKRLIFLHPTFHVSLLIPTLNTSLSPHILSLLHSLPPSIHVTILPPITSLPPSLSPPSLMRLTVNRSLPSLKHELLTLKTQRLVSAIVVDNFAVDALDVAEELNIPSYVYHLSSAIPLSFLFYFHKLDDDDDVIVSRTFGNLKFKQPLKLPGCIPLQPNDLTHLVHEQSSDFHQTLLHICKRLRLAHGVLFNSFVELEPDTISALQDRNANPPVYPVGPIIQTESSNSNNNNNLESASLCLEWLNTQPVGSVLYVSFGSGGTLSQEQLDELALGLEMSGHRFIWVVRPPSGDADSAYLNAQTENPLDYLPKGFIERTKGRGYVVKSWAPQVEILRHVATGGFLSHCGWNSTLESVVNGKPMIAWPLFAEQNLNAVLLTQGLKIAVRVKVNNEKKGGIVERDEVVRVVKCVMESDEMRKRAQGFKEAAAKALSQDGSSTKTLDKLAMKWKSFSTSM